jgi:hypothetical protein
LRVSRRLSTLEGVVAAVAKKRAVGAWKWVRISSRVRPPHTPDGAAAFDTSPDLLEVHAEVRVRMTEPRVHLDRLLFFTLGGHTLLSVLPPKKLREPLSSLLDVFCHKVARSDSQRCTLRLFAQK